MSLNPPTPKPNRCHHNPMSMCGCPGSLASDAAIGRSLLAALETAGMDDLTIVSAWPGAGFLVFVDVPTENDATRALAAELSAAKVNG